MGPFVGHVKRPCDVQNVSHNPSLWEVNKVNLLCFKFKKIKKSSGKYVKHIQGKNKSVNNTTGGGGGGDMKRKLIHRKFRSAF